MKLRLQSLRRYRLALPEPIGSAKELLFEREGAIVVIRDDEGFFAEGECAPLPSFNGERLDDACDVLGNVKEIEIADGVSASECAAAWLREMPLTPSARFALETAVFDLFETRLGRPALPMHREQAGVAFAKVIRDKDGAVAALRAGASALKLKVSTKTSVRDIAEVAECLPKSAQLRLDFNRNLSVNRAMELFAALHSEGVALEFAEEPLDAGLLGAQFSSPYSIAADETLSADDARTFEALRAMREHANVRVLVLKPMMLGGVLPCLELATRAKELGLSVTVSHSWDGPTAHKASMRLARALAYEPLACGLWPHSVLESWSRVEVGRELLHS